MIRKVYLDTNILVATFSDATSDKERKKDVVIAFETLSQLKDLEMYISTWAITELVKVLIADLKMEPVKVSEIEKDLINEGRLHGMKIKILDVSPRHDYDFREFFYHIRRGILSNSSGVGDNIHSIIMKNNEIEHILTSNTKDFINMPGVIALEPKNIKLEG